MTEQHPSILCVDDDPAILAGLKRTLRRHYAVTTAQSGINGLAVIASHGPFGAVISDLHMPGIDGLAFLSRARSVAPDTTRILLTGRADIQSAIAAVNQGQLFRFLCKPVTPEDLLLALDAAVAQHRLLTAERELLERTLKGSIDALVEALGLASPAAFARANRIRTIVAEIAAGFGAADAWMFEIAAVLSQIGAVTLPAGIVDKLHRGQQLTRDEQALADRLPDLAARVLTPIPRMDKICAAILAQRVQAGIVESPDDLTRVDAIPLGGRLLRVALDLDQLESRGMTRTEAVHILRKRIGCYDQRLVDVLCRVRHDGTLGAEEITMEQLRAGMIVAQDIRDVSDVLLIGRGQQVTDAMLEMIRNRARRGRTAATMLVTSTQPHHTIA